MTIGTDVANVDITELDNSLQWNISATPGSISEDLEQSTTFTVTLSGSLSAGNTSSVEINIFDDADGVPAALDGSDYTQAFLAALDDALLRNNFV